MLKPRSLTPWLALAAVTLIASFFRFYRLADHPLGIFFDPAINGLDAVRLMQRGGHVFFFPTNGGRESLFMYLLMPYIWFFNTTPFSLRALTVTISLLNIVLLFGFLYESPLINLKFKTQNPNFQIWFATFGSLVLATSYWHITISRLGQRPILVPMLSVPIFWFFLKGWVSGQKRWFILAGLLMGLAGYTYSAARLLPVILVLALLPEFLPSPFGRPGSSPSFRRTGPNLLLFILAALIVYLPMAWYLVSHPGQFTARASSVMIWNFLDTPTDIVAEMGRNTLRVLGFFCCSGSPNPIFGLPGYPGLSPLLTPFLLIGLVMALKNWRNLFQRLVVLWWLIGIFPSIFAIEAPHPLRMIAAVPPTAILVALGLIYFLNWLQSRFSLHTWPFWATLFLILLPIPALHRAYFIEWTELQATRGVYDYGAIAIRDTILEHAGTETPIYLPLSRFNDSTLLFYLSGHFQRQASLSAPRADTALVISPDKNANDPTWVRLHNHTATILPPLTAEGQNLLQAALSGDTTRPIRTTDGEIVARQALMTTDPVGFVQQPTHHLDTSYGPLRLTGASYSMVIDPAQELPVTLFWQANAEMVDEYEILVRLVDDNRRARGNGDARPTDWVYPTSFWGPGFDQVAARHAVTIESAPLEPGRYWLAVSVFDPALGQRLPLTAGLSDSPDTVFIGPLKVPLPTPSPVPGMEEIPAQQAVTFGDVAQLAGFVVNQPTVKPGESIQLTLLWQALATTEADYTVFVHLLDPNDHFVTGNDTQPVGGRYPTTIWTPGERIPDVHTLPVPAGLSPGQYHLAIGLYQQPTGKRLILRFPDGHEDPQGLFGLDQTVTITDN